MKIGNKITKNSFSILYDIKINKTCRSDVRNVFCDKLIKDLRNFGYFELYRNITLSLNENR